MGGERYFLSLLSNSTTAPLRDTFPRSTAPPPPPLLLLRLRAFLRAKPSSLVFATNRRLAHSLNP